MRRLSWLGDAILGALVSDLTFHAQPSATTQAGQAASPTAHAPSVESKHCGCVTATCSDSYKSSRCSLPLQELHEARMRLVRRETCSEFGAKLGVDKLLAVGAGYEGTAPTVHMVAGGRAQVAGHSLHPKRGLPGLSRLQGAVQFTLRCVLAEEGARCCVKQELSRGAHTCRGL